ncbi:MAG: DUF1292 domain-containing protein [Paenibacillaceae bacterium]
MFFEAKDTLESNLLQRTFGDEVILFDEGKESIVYKVLREFRLGEQIYAVLRSSKISKDVEYDLFRVVSNDLSEVNLETIEDDEEWEAIAEVYDEMTFAM